jgi:mannose-1-phosphate guanylyltransferase
MDGKRYKTAFILGAGLGTRLKPLTDQCPKPLLPVGGRPLITYAMDHLLSAGVERFIVNTHHCPDAYQEKFPNNRWRDVPIVFRHEPVLLDTAGGLKNIEDLLEDDRTIFCYNGDIITDIPLKQLMQFHEQHSPEATLALRSSGTPMNVELNEQNEICDIRGILRNRGARSCLFASVYILEKSILKWIEPGRIETIITTFIQRIVDQPGAIMGTVIDEGAWYNIDSIQSYQDLNSQIKDRED